MFKYLKCEIEQENKKKHCSYFWYEKYLNLKVLNMAKIDHTLVVLMFHAIIY